MRKSFNYIDNLNRLPKMLICYNFLMQTDPQMFYSFAFERLNLACIRRKNKIYTDHLQAKYEGYGFLLHNFENDEKLQKN